MDGLADNGIPIDAMHLAVESLHRGRAFNTALPHARLGMSAVDPHLNTRGTMTRKPEIRPQREDTRPPTNPVGDMVCAHCKEPLNRRLDLDTGNATWLHGRAVTYEHEATPVPRADVADVVQFCDFCASTAVAWMYRTRGEITQILATPNYTAQDERRRVAKHWEALSPKQAPATEHGQNVYSDTWAACVRCAEYIELRDVERLITHVRRSNKDFESLTRAFFRQHFSEFFRRVGARETAASAAASQISLDAEEATLGDREAPR